MIAIFFANNQEVLFAFKIDYKLNKMIIFTE